MPEFARRWNNFSTEEGGNPSDISARSPYVTSGTSLRGTFSEKTCSPPAQDAFSDHLLSRLQAGSQWLTAQHQAWLDEDSAVTNDELFSVALSAYAMFTPRRRQSPKPAGAAA